MYRENICKSHLNFAVFCFHRVFPTVYRGTKRIKNGVSGCDLLFCFAVAFLSCVLALRSLRKMQILLRHGNLNAILFEKNEPLAKD